MGTANKLSIEVYRDLDTSSKDLEPVMAGIEGLLKYTDALDIDEYHEPIYVYKNKYGELSSENQEEMHRADIGIYVSHAAMDGTDLDANKIYGAAWYTPSDSSPIGTRIAVISLHNNQNLELVSGHETAHTLNMKHFGRKENRNGHCVDSCCVMYHGAARSKFEERIMNVINRIDARLKHIPEYADATDGLFSLKTYCSDCRTELANNTEMLVDAKNGLSVPDNLLFPGNYR